MDVSNWIALTKVNGLESRKILFNTCIKVSVIPKKTYRSSEDICLTIIRFLKSYRPIF